LRSGASASQFAEDQALVGFHARLQRAPVGLVEAAIAFLLVTESLFFVGHVDQVAGNVIRPAVVSAGEGLCITRIGAANAHATVAALVQEDFDAAVLLPHHDHRVFAHVGVQVVPGLGDVGFMPEQQPGARKDALEFNLVELLVCVDARVDQALVLINQGADGFVRPATLERHRHGLHFAFRMYSHDADLLKTNVKKPGACARSPGRLHHCTPGVQRPSDPHGMDHQSRQPESRGQVAPGDAVKSHKPSTTSVAMTMSNTAR